MAQRSSADAEHNAHERELDAIAKAGERLKSELPVDRGAYLRHYYAQVDLEESAGEPATLARAALAHLEWARTRKVGTALVRVFNPTRERDGWTSKHTI